MIDWIAPFTARTEIRAGRSVWIIHVRRWHPFWFRTFARAIGAAAEKHGWPRAHVAIVGLWVWLKRLVCGPSEDV